MTNHPEGRKPCPGCAKGDTPELMDEGGTFSRVSGRPGRLGHGVDDYFWFCDDDYYRPLTADEREKLIGEDQ